MSVLVSIATKRNLHAELVKWLLSLAPGEAGIDIVNDPHPLEHVRNLQVKRFLNSPFERLFIVDSDCVPPRDSVKLIQSFDLPILSIPHPANKGDETGYMVLDRSPDGKGYVQHRKLIGLQECDAVGCSGLAIKREVFIKIGTPHFRFIYNDEGFLSKGEDFDFCGRAKKKGYKIYAYCDQVQRHYVEMVI